MKNQTEKPEKEPRTNVGDKRTKKQNGEQQNRKVYTFMSQNLITNDMIGSRPFILVTYPSL